MKYYPVPNKNRYDCEPNEKLDEMLSAFSENGYRNGLSTVSYVKNTLQGISI